MESALMDVPGGRDDGMRKAADALTKAKRLYSVRLKILRLTRMPWKTSGCASGTIKGRVRELKD